MLLCGNGVSQAKGRMIGEQEEEETQDEPHKLRRRTHRHRLHSFSLCFPSILIEGEPLLYKERKETTWIDQNAWKLIKLDEGQVLMIFLTQIRYHIATVGILMNSFVPQKKREKYFRTDAMSSPNPTHWLICTVSLTCQVRIKNPPLLPTPTCFCLLFSSSILKRRHVILETYSSLISNK